MPADRHRPPGKPCVLAIVGSRDFPDVDAIRDFINALRPTTTVLSGGARGVDMLAVNAAKARGLAVEVIPADWDTLGRAAGPARNTLIVERADYVVAFWDGQSRGTADTIAKAREAGKLFRVIYPRKSQ